MLAANARRSKRRARVGAGLATPVTREPLDLGEQGQHTSGENRISDRPLPRVDALLVFVGDGLGYPREGYNDLAGLRPAKARWPSYSRALRPISPSALSAHHQLTRRTVEGDHRCRSAIGVIMIPNPASMDIPWSRMSLNLQPSSAWTWSERNSMRPKERSLSGGIQPGIGRPASSKGLATDICRRLLPRQGAQSDPRDLRCMASASATAQTGVKRRGGVDGNIAV